MKYINLFPLSLTQEEKRIRTQQLRPILSAAVDKTMRESPEEVVSLEDSDIDWDVDEERGEHVYCKSIADGTPRVARP